MKRAIVVFPVTKENRWSYISLATTIEAHKHRSFPFLWFNMPRSNRSGLLNAIDHLLNEYRRIVLAYSFMTPQWSEIKKEWRAIRSKFKDGNRVMIIAGGPHPSGAVKDVLEAECAGVFVGEAEESFIKSVNLLLDGAVEEFPAGFYRVRDGRVAGLGPVRFKGWEESFPFPTDPPRVGPVEITRGCPFKCSYCATSVLKGATVRHRRLDVIVEAVRFMLKLGKRDIRFITPNALSYGSATGREPDVESLDALLSSIRRILPSDGKIFFGSFPSEVRPEFINEDTVKIIATYCANKNIVIGAQSGSDRMLRLMHRGHSVEDVLMACDILIRYGFTPAVDMIFGLPYENEEDLLTSLDVMNKLSTMGARIHAHHFIPLPGSRWSALKPTPIPSFLRRYLERLIAKGKLFGQWMRQERIAETI